jgi:hypothetical protein
MHCGSHYSVMSPYTLCWRLARVWHLIFEYSMWLYLYLQMKTGACILSTETLLLVCKLVACLQL